MPSNSLVLPPPLPGTSHFVSDVHDVTGRHRMRRPQGFGLWLVESLCSGTGGESLAHKLMSIPVRNLGFADQKKTARKWLKHHWHGENCCIFLDIQSYIDGNGKCDRHGGGNCNVAAERPDCAIGGLPCPPWSKQRFKKGETKATGKASAHPMFRVVFELSGLYLDRRRPHVFWIEEVNTFGAEGPNGEEVPVQILMRICVTKGSPAGHSLRITEIGFTILETDAT